MLYCTNHDRNIRNIIVKKNLVLSPTVTDTQSIEIQHSMRNASDSAGFSR